MKRKLIKQGAGGLTVCLPKKWTDRNNLKPADELEIEEQNNSLIITADKAIKIITARIEVKNIDYFSLFRLITNNYKRGVDELEIVSDKNIQKDVEKILMLLIGFNIVEVKKNSILIKSYLSEKEEDIQPNIKRCFFQLKDTLNIVTEDISRRKYSNQDIIKRMYVDVKKLTNYALRTTLKTVNDKEIIQLNTVLFSNLNLFGNKIDYIYSELKKEKNVRPITAELVSTLIRFLDLCYNLYYTRKMEHFFEIQKVKEDMEKKINNNINYNGKILLQISQAERLLYDSLGFIIRTL